MKYAITSILVSLVVIFCLVRLNLEITESYHNATGKTKALFGFILLGYQYKYFYLIGCALSGACIFISYFASEPYRIRIVAWLLFVISVASVVIDFWRWLPGVE